MNFSKLTDIYHPMQLAFSHHAESVTSCKISRRAVVARGQGVESFIRLFTKQLLIVLKKPGFYKQFRGSNMFPRLW